MIRAFARLPISVRVPIMSAALMVLVGLIASHQVLTALTRAQEARLEELMRLHVDGLSVALGPSVLREDVWEVYDTLDRARQAGADQRMILTVVSDSDGQVIAATDPRRAPVGSELSDLTDLDTVPKLDEIALTSADGHVRVLAPLVYQGRGVGRILTEMDVSDLAAERRRATLALIVFNTVATGGLALIGLVVTRRMLRPISVLAGRMAAGAGRPEPIPPQEVPSGDSEVARLFRTYNDMVDAIAAKSDTERRLAERERLVSLGRLSSSLAHEINNPLGGLLNAADTIETYAERPDTVRKSAGILVRGLRHLRDVSAAALDHNRVDRRGEALKPEDLEDLRMLVAPEAQRQRQSLGWMIDASADDLAPHPAGPVRQIALNLVLNALNAAGPSGTVSLRVDGLEDGLQLVVTDGGPGLSEAALRRLFSSAPTEPGGGVGLRVVRDLVSSLGGRIAHDRHEGRTVITVTLPGKRAREVA
ncbi:HAMP domain-containing sensor histidine kinase [Sediminimonas sp.]|uniref:sensor histidine kinase n=1 Tax=Sediminimonas sp. TaxID=2823379 RepID=UPI0025F37B79|nr:HAMP domain-containing sensor histidine kinase [Sediminimonas sp.]